MKTLIPRAIATLNRASATEAERAFGDVKSHLPQNRWLSKANAYQSRTIARIARDLQPPRNIKPGELIQYIASSSLLHCADGWTFLSRSLDCNMRGNFAATTHFAYYAELRAAISILATQGIGVFNTTHFVVEGRNLCTPLPQSLGTHDFAWLALEHWAAAPSSGRRLLDIFSVAGTSLADWLDSFQGSAAVAGSVAGMWLANWGLDLKRFAADKDARNEASYRPGGISGSAPSSEITESSRFLRTLWGLFEPSVSRFESVDRHLLRTTLEKVFVGRGRRRARNNARFEKEVDNMLAKISIGPQQRAGLKEFFVWRTDPAEPSLITMANSGKGNNHLEVVARAALLLRVASGLCARILNVSGLTRSDLEFWISSFGETRGFWPPGGTPGDLTELWGDVSAAVSDESVWIDGIPAGSINLYDWRLNRLTSLSTLGECDRIALWGLGL